MLTRALIRVALLAVLGGILVVRPDFLPVAAQTATPTTSTPITSAPPTCINPSITVSPSSASAGGQIHVAASGFRPNATVTIEVSGPSSTSPGSARADSACRVQLDIQVVSTDSPGTYTVRLSGPPWTGETTLVRTVSFVVLQSAGPTALQATPVTPTVDLGRFRSVIRSFVDQTGGAIKAFDVRVRRTVRDTSEIDGATQELADQARFITIPPAPFRVTGLSGDSVSNPELLSYTRDVYRRSLRGYIGTGDVLVTVEWTPQEGDTFITVAVLSSAGDYRYEPILDSTPVAGATVAFQDSVTKTTGEHALFEPAVEQPVAALAMDPTSSASQGDNSQLWVHEVRNVLGINKAWGALAFRSVGPGGCAASFAPPDATTGDRAPYEVARAGDAGRTSFFSPKEGCPAPSPDAGPSMQCEEVSQRFEVVMRLPPWVGPDLQRYQRTVVGSLCADGSFSGERQQ